jgi:chromosome segregation ATPase
MTAPTGSVQEQLSLVISMLKEHGKLLVDTRKMLADNQAKVSVLENKVSTLESTVVKLESDVLALKEASNSREQQLKLCTVRVHGLPVTDEELAATDGGKTLAAKVYERILKPILERGEGQGRHLIGPPLCQRHRGVLQSWAPL